MVYHFLELFVGEKKHRGLRTNLQSMMEDPANQAPMSTGGALRANLDYVSSVP